MQGFIQAETDARLEVVNLVHSRCCTEGAQGGRQSALLAGRCCSLSCLVQRCSMLRLVQGGNHRDAPSPLWVQDDQPEVQSFQQASTACGL